MTDIIQKYHGGFKNNFDIIRLILSTSVVLLHFDHLVNNPDVTSVLIYTEIISSYAVKAFFVVSGFVVYMSFDSTQDFKKYFISRLLRLYPAYLVSVLIIASLPLFLSTCNNQDAFNSTWVKYIFANLFFLNFLQPNLPCIFESNFDNALNGSLWTIKIEVMFYAIVPIIYLLIKRFGGFLVLILIYTISMLYTYSMLALAEKSGSDFYTMLAHQLPGQMAYFSTGIFIYLYYKKFSDNLKLLFPISFIPIYFSISPLEPLGLGIIVIALSTASKPHFNLSKLGDISYGIYLFHFPIIQIFLQFNLFNKSPFLLLAASLTTTLIIANISWRFIEKPASKLKIYLYKTVH